MASDKAGAPLHAVDGGEGTEGGNGHCGSWSGMRVWLGRDWAGAKKRSQQARVWRGWGRRMIGVAAGHVWESHEKGTSSLLTTTIWAIHGWTYNSLLVVCFSPMFFSTKGIRLILGRLARMPVRCHGQKY
jgi:hypothetical protein